MDAGLLTLENRFNQGIKNEYFNRRHQKEKLAGFLYIWEIFQ
jgi:hypothetical protein